MFHNMRNTYVLTIRLLWIWLRLLNLVHHQVGIAYIYFGRDYGRFLFLIRLNILPRELLVIYCLLKITLITDISWWIAHVIDECGASNESLLHLFWDCPKATEMWAISKLFHALPLLHFRSLMDFLWYVLM